MDNRLNSFSGGQKRPPEILPLTQRQVDDGINRIPLDDSISLKKQTFMSTLTSTVTFIRLASHVIIGIIIGSIYFNVGNDASLATRNTWCILLAVTFGALSAFIPSILSCYYQKSKLLKENSSYDHSTILFKTLVDIAFEIEFSVVFACIVYYLTSQPNDLKRFTMFTGIFVLTFLVSQSLGLLIASSLSVVIGAVVGIFSAAFLIILPGIIFIFDNNIQWTKYFSFGYYGFEGAIISLYGMDREKLKCLEVYCRYKSPRQILEDLSMESAVYWIDVMALIGIFAAIKTTTYYVMKWKCSSKC